jgi:hypothetical protein
MDAAPIPDEASPPSTGSRCRWRSPCQRRRGEREDQKGSGAYRMKSGGVVALHDVEGCGGSTVCHGRMPDRGPGSLEDSLSADLAAALWRRPKCRVMGLAHGALEMRQMLDRVLPEDPPEAISPQFWSLTGKVGKAIAAAGRSAAASRSFWRAQLLSGGRAIERIAAWPPTWAFEFDAALSERLRGALTYDEKNRQRMRFASRAEAGLSAPCAIIEATCETHVTVGVTRSDRRCRETNGQANLSQRSLARSSPWNSDMTLLRALYFRGFNPGRSAA